MGEKVKGKLIIIGGAEDKKRDCIILKKVAELSGGADAVLVVITTAAEHPHDVGFEYKNLFKKLGIRHIEIINIGSRDEANDEFAVKILNKATGIFFTGGDQLRITSLLGGSRVYKSLHNAYKRGVVIAGTSAGASAMSDNMIVEGDSDDTPKRSIVNLAPGMGLLEEVVIDQHFAQRGRIGRLLGAIAQNPYILGIGIDEDTAILVEPDARFTVVGSKTATVVDGQNITYSNVSELKPDEALALFNITLHLLPAGHSFDLKERKPIIQYHVNKRKI